MQIESRKNNRNKNAKRLNLLKGRQPRNPSQTNGGAKVRINSEIAIPKLKKLAQDYIGVTDPQGFLTDLRIALGIPNSQGASKYGEVTIPKEDGSELKASLRITNHQANAEQYIKHDANYEYNLSIVVRRKERRNTFTPHEDVRLDEFVYYGKNIAQVENPLTQIVNGIIEFLQNGKYEDTTGVALKNTSPITTENNRLNCNLNMNKKLIRLTESNLQEIIREAVEKVLQSPEVGPGGILNWASGQAYTKSRNLIGEYEKLMKIVQKADTETRGSYYAEKLKELSVGYNAMRELARLDVYGGSNEGSGFSSNGIGYF